MRKFFRLLGDFFCNNRLRALALLIIIASTCVIFSSSIADYNYDADSLAYFDRDEFERADYVNIYESFEDRFMEQNYTGSGLYDATDFNEAYGNFVKSDVYTQIKKLPAVDKVYSYTEETLTGTYNNTSFDLIFGDIDTHRVFDYRLSDGCWFWDAEQSSEYPNAVVCGSLFESVPVGSDIDIKYLGSMRRIHVIGKVSAPYHTVEFTNSLVHGLNTYRNKIFFLNDETSLKTFGETIKRYPSDAIVTYKADATDEEIKECQDFYKSFFTESEIKEYFLTPFYELDDMIAEARQSINEEINNMLRRDLVFLFIATFIFIALTVLMVKKKLHDYYIFYFCGCTRKKSFWLSVAGISIIAIIAGLIASGYIMYSYYMISHGYYNGSQNSYVFDYRCHLVVWLYLAVVVLVSCIIPFIMVASKKSTLMSLYRKGKE